MAEVPLIPVSRLLRYECLEDRALMPERGRGHHCAACDKTVVDMSRLTLLEAVDTAAAVAAPSSSAACAAAKLADASKPRGARRKRSDYVTMGY